MFDVRSQSAAIRCQDDLSTRSALYPFLQWSALQVVAQCLAPTRLGGQATLHFNDVNNPAGRYDRQTFESRLLIDGRSTQRRARKEGHSREAA